MDTVLVASTNNRSVVGTMVDFAKVVPYYLSTDVRWGEREMYDAEAKLADTPCRCTGRNTMFPDLETVALLSKRWSSTPRAS